MLQHVMGLLAAVSLTGAAAASDWHVDQAASTVGFETSVMGEALSGRFDRWTAQIHLDPDSLAAASISARVETGSGHVGGGHVGGGYDETLRGEDGLAVAVQPLALFESRDIRATATGYEAHGELTIRETTRPVILPFTLVIAGDHAVADARLEIARSDYGVGADAWGSVAARVTLVLHIEAEAAN